MGVDVHGDVEVAALAAVRSGMPLPGHADARAVRESGRHADGQRLRPHLHLLSATSWTPRVNLPARPSTRRARLGKHHVPARRLDNPGAVAVQASALARLQPSGASACSTVLLTGDRDLALAAP